MGGSRVARLSTHLLLVSIVALVSYHRIHLHLLMRATTLRNVISINSPLDASFLAPHLTPKSNSYKKHPATIFSEQSSSSPPWAFFYNIYMPPDEGNATLVYHILDEQLHQVGISHAAMYQNKSLTVYYNTIGHSVNQSFMEETCRRWNSKMKCVHMEHFDQAFEEKTLARVHEYCHHHPEERVGYIHNKGSFNSRNSRNEWWRRYMTLAVTHRDCLKPPDDFCDICGLNFYATPFIHYSGNFFTAKCSYINKLLPIEEFRERMSSLANITNEYEQQGRFLFHTFRNQDTYLGLDRYASEAWPGSHPSVAACDLSAARRVDFWKKERGDAFDHLNFSLAPRSTDPSGKFLHTRRTLRNKPTYLMREYWLLAGNMFKWIRLYGDVPPKTSWVWSFFPDGNIWLNGYKEFGKDVVESLLDPFAMKDGNLSLPMYFNVTKYPHATQEMFQRRTRQKARRLRRKNKEKTVKVPA